MFSFIAKEPFRDCNPVNDHLPGMIGWEPGAWALGLTCDKPKNFYGVLTREPGKATLPGKQRTRSRINCRFWKWTFWHALDTSVLSQNQKKELDTSKLLNICKILEQLFYLEQLLDSNCLGTRGSTTNQAVFLEGTPHFTPPRPSTYRCSPKVLGYSGLESCLLFHANTALAGFVLLVVSSLLE